MKNKGKFCFAFLMSVVLTACFVFAAFSNDEDENASFVELQNGLRTSLGEIVPKSERLDGIYNVI